MEEKRPSRWWRLLVLALLLAAVAAFFLTGLPARLGLDSIDGIRGIVAGWKRYADDNRVAAMLILFAVYVVCTSLSLPSSLGLSLVAGALFGILWGLALVSVASTLGACVAFLLARYLFRDSIQRRFGERLRPINRGIERDGAWYLLALRLTPVVPYFLINAAMGLTPMPLATFAVVSWLGMLPVALVIVMTGQELGKIRHLSDVFTPGVLGSLLAMAVVPLLLRWAMRRWVKEEAS